MWQAVLDEPSVENPTALVQMVLPLSAAALEIGRLCADLKLHDSEAFSKLKGPIRAGYSPWLPFMYAALLRAHVNT